MIFDVNAWVGHWPFRSLRDNTPAKLLERMDRDGIGWAAVSAIEAIFHRNVQPANEQLAEDVAPFADRLFPVATINPTYVGWERDLRHCHEELGMRGVRLFPQYHGYDVDSRDTRRAVAACRERDIPVCFLQRMEDPRQKHHLDPGKTIDLGQVANIVAAERDAKILILNARGIAGSPLVRREDIRHFPWYVDLALGFGHYQGDLPGVVTQAGAHHLVFGSHLPFSYTGCALVKLAVLPIDHTERENISYRTAEKLFGIDLRIECRGLTSDKANKSAM